MPSRSWLSRRAGDLRFRRTVEVSTMKVEMSEKRKKCDREFGEGVVRIVGETGKPIV